MRRFDNERPVRYMHRMRKRCGAKFSTEQKVVNGIEESRGIAEHVTFH
jgi:hypothetical protein